ncbi:MAG TPA: TadE/TadG family type IV pilus assembly protein [Telluria sp.]|jgi:Flp pilus assembly protein TadG
MQAAFRPHRRRTRGATMIEFAFTLPLFLLFMLGLLEVARALYLWNVLANATAAAARSAAMVDATDQGALDALAQAAGLAARAGGMALGTAQQPDARIVITHLDATFKQVVALPACPSQNIVKCNANPNGSNCVRFVRAQLCAPGSGTECAPATYKPLFTGTALGLEMTYPTFATITPAASLGHQAGSTEVCPGP